MDLLYIKKRILEKSEFRVISEHTFTPRLTMRIYGMSTSCALKREEIEDLKFHGLGVESHLRDLLINEFISNNKYLTKFLQIENREKNLNQLLDEDTTLGL